jgi:hypothetical protein
MIHHIVYSKLNVSMQTLDAGEVVASPALLDCRATGLFINSNFVKAKNLMTKKLSQPINVYNVDSTPNKARKVLGGLGNCPSIL